MDGLLEAHMTTVQHRDNGIPAPTTSDQDAVSGLTEFAMMIATRNHGWRITHDHVGKRVLIRHADTFNSVPFPDTTEGRTLALAVLVRLNSKL